MYGLKLCCLDVLRMVLRIVCVCDDLGSGVWVCWGWFEDVLVVCWIWFEDVCGDVLWMVCCGDELWMCWGWVGDGVTM